jgi:hypothetical protein
MNKLMNIHFAGAELMTGLPEYRNGGLFIDTGVLTLKNGDMERGLEEFHRNAVREGKKGMEVVPMFTPDDDVVVEWRAVTVVFLDLLLEEVNKMLGLSGGERLSLPQMLEAGSWKVCALFPNSVEVGFGLEVRWRGCANENREEEKWPRYHAQIPNVHRLRSSPTERSSDHLRLPTFAPSFSEPIFEAPLHDYLYPNIDFASTRIYLQEYGIQNTQDVTTRDDGEELAGLSKELALE